MVPGLEKVYTPGCHVSPARRGPFEVGWYDHNGVRVGKNVQGVTPAFICLKAYPFGTPKSFTIIHTIVKNIVIIIVLNILIMLSLYTTSPVERKPEGIYFIKHSGSCTPAVS